MPNTMRDRKWTHAAPRGPFAGEWDYQLALMPRGFGSARETHMVDALHGRSLLMRILDALAEWQMRQSLRAICRGYKHRT
jgi:hypothetical protein